MPKNFQSDETVIVNQLVQNLFEKEWKGKALLFLLIKCII
jgi:hypothetical protein